MTTLSVSGKSCHFFANLFLTNHVVVIIIQIHNIYCKGEHIMIADLLFALAALAFLDDPKGSMIILSKLAAGLMGIITAIGDLLK